MTYEEAIRVIESNRPTSGYTMLCEALDIAKEAIEKQIPKKPVEEATMCPNCGGNIINQADNDYNFNYCHYCGQKLDWNE